MAIQTTVARTLLAMWKAKHYFPKEALHYETALDARKSFLRPN